jgi:phosphatidylserine/phosphatidylglycerophosphate/cardiolipin synthase-like enzyme
MGGDIGLMFLQDGAQPADEIAEALSAFLAGARSSLDIAIYDCALGGGAAETVARALKQRAAAGVAVRIAYYAGPHESPTVPPPSGSSEAFLQPLGIPTRPITGYQALMHHKYVVRDADSLQAAVWTGSMNWTVDSWTREENVVVQFPSAPLAQLYRADFEEMWASGKLDNTGKKDGGNSVLSYGGDDVPTTVWFSPGLGRAMAHVVASAISHAQTRIVICSPVVTVGSILGSLGDVLDTSRVPVRGVVDATQMAEVREQWSRSPAEAWKIGAFDTLMHATGLAGKHSIPYGPHTIHDFMHAKMIIVDDTTFVGSYNFSHSGEENAENLLRFESSRLADTCVHYIDQLIARYGAVSG